MNTATKQFLKTESILRYVKYQKKERLKIDELEKLIKEDYFDYEEQCEVWGNIPKLLKEAYRFWYSQVDWKIIAEEVINKAKE